MYIHLYTILDQYRMIKMNNAEFRAYAVYNHVLQYVHKEILEDIFRIIVRVKYNEKK